MGALRTNHAVVIAGGGPTRLMLAAELTLAGTDVVIVERRATQDSTVPERGDFTPVPSRCSTSGASRDDSCRRGRSLLEQLSMDEPRRAIVGMISGLWELPVLGEVAAPQPC